MKRASLIAIVALTAAPAAAGTVTVAPDACALAAETAPYEAADAEAEDLNPWRSSLEDELLYLDEDTGESGAQIRVFPDPETGNTIPEPKGPSCSHDAAQ